MTCTGAGQVIDCQGELPRFWNEDVLFFANLFQMFVGDGEKLQELRETVGEVESYGGRLVPVLSLLYGGEHNTLVLEHDPAEAFCRYFRDDLGLRLPEVKPLVQKEYERFGKRWQEGECPGAESEEWLAPFRTQPARRVDGYVTDGTLMAIARSLGKSTTTTALGWKKGNNKLLLHRYVERAGLPLIPTETVACPVEVPAALESLARQGFRRAVLKSQVGASGVGMKKWPDLTRVAAAWEREVPPHFFGAGEIMVQGWLEPGWNGIRAIHSPSVQFFLNGEDVILYDVTEQILSRGSVHEGNFAPPPYLRHWPGLRTELIRQAGLVGTWLAGEGYRGPGSVDFLVAEQSGLAAPEVYVCEANARVTGATYPSLLARCFTPDGAWLMRNLRFGEPLRGRTILERLGRERHLYEPGKNRGVLPINVNYGTDDSVRKGQFLCLGPSPEDCLGSLVAAEHDLPVVLQADEE